MNGFFEVLSRARTRVLTMGHNFGIVIRSTYKLWRPNNVGGAMELYVRYWGIWQTDAMELIVWFTGTVSSWQQCLEQQSSDDIARKFETIICKYYWCKSCV